MNIILQNIQSIENVTYPLPDTGFVKIEGGNSNGKSILVKTIGAIASLQIMDNEKRRALINDQCDCGFVSIEYKGKSLHIKLHEERNQCYVALVRENGEKIIRTFREGGIEDLLNEFGFRTFNKNQICLQVYETFGMMPFVNTSTSVNGEIVEAITEDTQAKEFLKNYKEVTHKQVVTLVKNLNEKIAATERFRNSLLIFKYHEYEKYSKEMRNLFKDLEYFDPIEPLEALPLPVKLDGLDVECEPLEQLWLPIQIDLTDFSVGNLGRLPIIGDMPVGEKIESLGSIMREIQSIKEGVCPTCGRTFVE